MAYPTGRQNSAQGAPVFQKLRSLFGRPSASAADQDRPEVAAATQLPPAPPPKVQKGSKSYPGFFKTTKPDPKQPIRRDDRNVASADLLNYRNGNDTRKIIHDYAHTSPDLSAALWAYLRVGIPSKYTAIAKSAVDGTIDVAATTLLQQIITRMDVMPDYTEGYSNVQSLKSLSESLAKELMMYGAMAGELILDKSRLPSAIQPVSVFTIQFKPDGKGLKPVQRVGNEEIDLDIPTFVMLGLDQDLTEAYPSSPFESAIKPVLFKEEFAQDIHKIIKRVIHPRQKAKINEEMFRKNLDQEAQLDPEKAKEAMNQVTNELQNLVNNLAPDEALVHFDTVDFEVENPSNAGLASEYEVLQQIGNSRLSTGAKTMGTILGFQGGSSNIASSETMLFMKSATSAVKDKLDLFYSRIFTTALRLFGLDVVVEFRYADIDLRPEADLSAFRQTQQMMTLEKLSLGLITDEEASLTLTGKLPPSGYKPLSGTMFHLNKGGQSADTQEPTNSGSTLNQNLNGDTPAVGRGQNKKAEVVTLAVGAK